MQPAGGSDVVVVADDPRDAAALVRLAAVADCTGRRCGFADLRADWRSAGAVVVDERSARRCVAARLPRRDRVLVVTTTSTVSASTWRDALALGADQVLVLADQAKIAEWLAGLAEPAAVGRLLCCMSARGGAGASTLSAALALAAAGDRDTLLLDGDVQGGGIDYLLGIEAVEGARWPQLRDACGLLPATALADSLPKAGRLRVLAARGSATSTVPQPALTAVVEAGLRSHAVVVADVDRGGHTAPVWTSYAEVTLLVVPCEVRATVNATALVREVASRCADVRLVVRPGPGDLRPKDVEAAVGAPVAVLWPWERRLAAVTESGGFHRGWRGTGVAGIASSLLKSTPG
jgi:secretion/DNA translocation related CpaE-like protein